MTDRPIEVEATIAIRLQDKLIDDGMERFERAMVVGGPYGSVGECSFEVTIEGDAVQELFDTFTLNPGQKLFDIEMQLGRVKARECPPIGETTDLVIGVHGAESVDLGPLRIDRYQPSDGDGPAWMILGRYV